MSNASRDIKRDRERLEREVCLYTCRLYRLEDQPPYMPELRALYMAVRETYKGGMKKGQTVNHQWPLRAGRGERRTGKRVRS